MLQKSLTAQVVLLLALATITASQDWQASGEGHGGWYGNIGDNAAPNIPKVRQDIDAVIDAGGTAYQIATRLSDGFNSYWDEAWNVAVTLTNAQFDVDIVLNAWAYLKHWFWVNGYRGHCFAIWKQWQGQEWRTFDVVDDSYASNSTERDLILGQINNNLVSLSERPNIWQFARIVKESCDSYQQGKQDTRYSVIAHYQTKGIDDFGLRYKIRSGRNYFFSQINFQPTVGDSVTAWVFVFEGEG